MLRLSLVKSVASTVSKSQSLLTKNTHSVRQLLTAASASTTSCYVNVQGLRSNNGKNMRSNNNNSCLVSSSSSIKALPLQYYTTNSRDGNDNNPSGQQQQQQQQDQQSQQDQIAELARQKLSRLSKVTEDLQIKELQQLTETQKKMNELSSLYGPPRFCDPFSVTAIQELNHGDDKVWIFKTGVVHREVRVYTPSSITIESIETLASFVLYTAKLLLLDHPEEASENYIPRLIQEDQYTHETSLLYRTTIPDIADSSSSAADLALPLQQQDLKPYTHIDTAIYNSLKLAAHRFSGIGFELVRQYESDLFTSSIFMRLGNGVVNNEFVSNVVAQQEQQDLANPELLRPWLAHLNIPLENVEKEKGTSVLGSFIINTTTSELQLQSHFTYQQGASEKQALAQFDEEFASADISGQREVSEALDEQLESYEEYEKLDETLDEEGNIVDYNEDDPHYKHLDNLSRRKLESNEIEEITETNYLQTADTERAMVQDFLDMPPERIRHMARTFRRYTKPWDPMSEDDTIQFITRHFVTISSEADQPAARRVTMLVKMDKLDFPDKNVLTLFKELVGTRLNGNILRISSSRFPLREQNRDYLRDLLVVLIHRSYQLALELPNTPLTAKEEYVKNLSSHLSRPTFVPLKEANEN